MSFFPDDLSVSSDLNLKKLYPSLLGHSPPTTSLLSSSSIDSSTDNESAMDPTFKFESNSIPIPAKTLYAYCQQFEQIHETTNQVSVQKQDCERLLRSQFSLDDKLFDKIWSVSDHNGDSKLNKVEYCLFLFIANSFRMCHVPLPSKDQVQDFYRKLSNLYRFFDETIFKVSQIDSLDNISPEGELHSFRKKNSKHNTIDADGHIKDEQEKPLLCDPNIARARPIPSKLRLNSHDYENSTSSSNHGMGSRNFSSDRLLLKTDNEILRLPPPSAFPEPDNDTWIRTVKQSATLQPSIGIVNAANFQKGHKRASSMGSANNPNFVTFPTTRLEGGPAWKGQIVSNSIASSNVVLDPLLVKSFTNMTVTPPGRRRSSQAHSVSSSHRGKVKMNEPGVVTFQDEASNDIEALLPAHAHAPHDTNLLSGSAFRAPGIVGDTLIERQRSQSYSSIQEAEHDLFCHENSSESASGCDSSSDSSYVSSEGGGGCRLIRPTSYAQAVEPETAPDPREEAPVHISKRMDPIQVLSAATGRPGHIIANLEPMKQRKLLKSLVKEAKLMNHILLRLNNELTGEIQELTDQRLNLSIQLQHLGLLNQR